MDPHQRPVLQTVQMRTTFSIIFTCLFTFLTCVWCCIRRNIPSPYDSKLRALATKLEILFWFVVTPELVASWTFRQWYEAGKLAKEFSYRGWTRRHALFLMMGGFVLTKNGLPIQVISTQLFRRLLQEGVIELPTLSEADIQERSKFHPMLASIVLLQVIWFAIQCLSRVATGLLITQLEVTTLTFVFFSAITLAFVWKKPLDVAHPVFIPVTPQFDCNRLIYQPANRRIPKSDFDREQRMDRVVKQINFIEHPSSQCRPSTPLSMQHPFHFFLLWPYRVLFRNFCELAIGLDDLPSSSELPPHTLKIPSFHLPDSGDVMLVIIPVTCLLGMGIGVVQSLFWSWGHFPTESGRLIWRVNSVISVGSCTVCFLIMAIIGLFSLLDRPRLVIIDLIVRVFAFSAAVFVIVSVVPFIVARIILVVLSFWSLKSLPEEAFEVVSWSRYIPHFS